MVSCGFSSSNLYAFSASSMANRWVIHFSGWIRSRAFHAASKRRALSQRPYNSGAIVLTCEEINRMRER